MPGVVHAFRQKEDDGRTLEQGGEHVRKVVVDVGETAEVFAAQSFDDQRGAAAGRGTQGNGENKVQPFGVPDVEIEEGKEVEKYGEKNAAVEDDAGSVGGQMQVGRLLVGGRHRHRVGIHHTFGHITALLRQILRLPQSDDSYKMPHHQPETHGQCTQRNNLKNTHR